MCLGIPGRVTELIRRDGVFAAARVEFAGLTRVCSIACVPDVEVDEYVVVHAGIAISRIDEVAARQALEELALVSGEPEWDEVREQSRDEVY